MTFPLPPGTDLRTHVAFALFVQDLVSINAKEAWEMADEFIAEGKKGEKEPTLEKPAQKKA